MHYSDLLPVTKTLSGYLIVLICLASFTCIASERKQAVADQIESLVYNDSISPVQTLHKLRPLAEESERNGWRENQLRARVLEVEVLLLLERINDAESLIEAVSSLADELAIDTLSLRLRLAQLRVMDAKGFSKETLTLHQLLIDTASALDEKGYAASVLLTVGESQRTNGNIEQALEQFQRAYALFKSVGNQHGQSDALDALSSLYSEFKDYPTALRYANEALTIRQSLGDQFNSSVILYNIGEIHAQAGHYDNAIAAFQKSLGISESIEDSIGIAWTYHAMADVAIEQQQFKKALELYKQSEALFHESGDMRKVTTSMLGQLECRLAMGENELTPLFKAVSQRVQSVNDTDITEKFELLSASVAVRNNNFKSAYELQKNISRRYKAELEARTLEQIQRLRISFDVEKMESDNAELQSENALQQKTILQQREIQTLWIAVALLSVLVITGILIVLAKQIKRRNRFRALALQDQLTNAPNRRAILRFAQDVLSDRENTTGSGLIAIVDLDDFKQINDTYGHDVGDSVLMAFAQSCKATLRQQDSYGRFGGEEWLLVITQSGLVDAQTIFCRLREALNTHHIDGVPEGKAITFSMGVTKYTANADLGALIKQADENLYKAKQSGKDRCYPQADTDRSFL